MPLSSFHPAVAAWFAATFPAPTAAQVQAWPAIVSGRNTLVAAPTGSGKTLTAFMAAIDALVREGLRQPLPDATSVVYVSPLKALSNDIHLNLEAPLAGIRAQLQEHGLADVEIRTAVRTGDTPPSERARMKRKPPHVLVTTPESLYVLLGSESGRAMLASTRQVIVDEIHSVAASKRGSHLALSLERLESLCGRRLTRIGLSATQKPIDEVARFLVGAGEPVVACPHPSLPPQAGEGEWVPCGSRSDKRTPALGLAARDCQIVDMGYSRRRDLALELPPTPLQAVMSNEQWALVYARIAQLAAQQRTTLVFVNTRRMAERAARHLADLLGKDAVAAHHGSLAKELRLDAEQRLKRGELRVLVATASLELGIDIGDVDLVCQLGSPRSIAAFLQRVGRSGHSVGGVPKGRLFPSTRDDLVECAALLDCVRRGELDALVVPRAPLDVLAQQIVAEVAMRECGEDELFELMRRAWPYRELARKDFDAVVRMLADGFSTRRGPRASYIHRDAVNRRLRGRRNGRMTAVTSGGTIPDAGDYAVLLEPAQLNIGTVNEDFAIESLAGDIFQLGNASYRIIKVEPGRVRVEDAHGMPPTIPFWLGEAPGRSDELSLGVSRLREEIAAHFDFAAESNDPTPQEHLSPRGDDAPLSRHRRECDGAPAPLAPAGARSGGWGEGSKNAVGDTGEEISELTKEASDTTVATQTEPAPEPSLPAPLPTGEGSKAALAWLTEDIGLDPNAASQLLDYFARQHVALGLLPTQHRLVLERFFDESGGTQLVIHTPWGSRINRAWGLALRKRFCRKFNFELQAAATENAIVLSLSTSHSFPLFEVSRYLHPDSAREVLVQALLDAPLFTARWRWNATNALALPRFAGGKKVAPQLQRMRSEDLLATVFPDQVACAENLVGEREVPDHPLVAQTLHDCLFDAMDTDGWLAVLRGLESGTVQVTARDTTTPSPFATEALNAAPYAFLDDAPLEERRTQAVMSRRYSEADAAEDLGRLDPEAIKRVREQAWPQPRDADEMHEALMDLGMVTTAEASANPSWSQWLKLLANDKRATLLSPFPCGANGGACEPLARASESAIAHGAMAGSCLARDELSNGVGVRAGEAAEKDATDEVSRIPARADGSSNTAPPALTPTLAPHPGPAQRAGRSAARAPMARKPCGFTPGGEGLWIAAERLPQAQVLFSDATCIPDIAVPTEFTERDWSREDAAVELVRARLNGLGPVPSATIAQTLSLAQTDVDLALLKLESEGFVMRGRFSPVALAPDAAEEWCERHLLARIHRYTLGRLRREIEPVAPGDFMRFLCDWQRASPATRVSGPEALAGILAQLEGFEAPAAAWESDLLPARIGDYSIAWLDDLCTAGRITWTRLRAATTGADDDNGAGRAAPVRATPIVLLPRRQLGIWTRLTVQRHEDAPPLSSRAQRVADTLAARGALFFDELVSDAHLLRTELEDALAELVARGRVHCDSFAGLRALLVPSAKRRSHQARRGRRARMLGIEDAGRWTLARRAPVAVDDDSRASNRYPTEAVEHVARTLLRRYGVVAWRLLEREAAWLPPWRELLRVYHRLEARGEIRGGRFIDGVSGEQFALPDAVGALRQVRKRPLDGQMLSVSALDPLNLAGTLLPGGKVPRHLGARLLLRDGAVIATLVAGRVELSDGLAPEQANAARRALLREPASMPVAARPAAFL